MPGLLIALIKQMKVTAYFLCLVKPLLPQLSAAEAPVSCFPSSAGSHPSHPVADPVVDTPATTGSCPASAADQLEVTGECSWPGAGVSSERGV